MKRPSMMCILSILCLGAVSGSVFGQLTEHVPAQGKLYVGEAELWRWRTNEIPVFNGTNLDGWTIQGDSRWTVENGALTARPGNREATTRGFAVSQHSFANFVLRFQYSIEPDPSVEPARVVNSGVFFRVPPGAARMALEGYEMEVAAHDDYEYPTGSIWRLNRSYPGLSQANFWNDAEIYADGEYIRISVNGQIASETFDRRSSEGLIAFQHQRNGIVRYRDIRLQELPDTQVLAPTIEDQLRREPAPFVPLFNGRDLSGWQAVAREPGMPAPRWGVENGCITLLGGAGEGALVTEAEYGNFILRLKFNMPGDGNSGIHLRCPRMPGWGGIEAQINNIRDYHHWNPTGSIYNLSQGMFGYFKYDDWNEYTIYLKNDRMVVYLNGTRTASAMVPYRTNLHNPMPPCGHIKIQAHEPLKKLQVKDIEIKVVR